MFASIPFAIIAILFAAFSVIAQNSSAGLDFGPINFAGYNNYVYRDNVTAAQIVITDSSSPSAPSRFITAFPNGNTGALVYFVPLNNSASSSSNSTAGGNATSTGLGTTLNFTTVSSVSQANNQTGIVGEISLSGDLEFGVTLIGSVRTLRDYVESGGTVFHSIFNYTLFYSSNSSVVLSRQWINGTTTQFLTFESVSNALITATPNANATIPPNITITRPDPSNNATVRFTHVYNYTSTTPASTFVPLEGLGKGDLFLTSTPANGTAVLGNVLSAIQNNGSAIANQVAFLSYADKFLAGGWRFLTYFGRDTLLALRLLLPVISSESAEAILGAVIERTNSTGALCHEETIGDYASFVNLQNNQSQLGNTPYYSYVMLDTDFLLLPVLAEYFLSSPQGSGRAQAFLAKQSTLVNGTFASLLQLNVDHVMALAQPFANNATKANLVPIRDPTVGDWRDSNSGLGYGIYPFDVNVALIPAALRAISSMASASLLPSNYSIASSYATTWETQPSQYFEVSISPSAAQNSLNNYVAQANLSQALLYSGGSLNNSDAANSNSSLGWSDAAQVIGGSSNSSSTGNSTFYALSLKADGSAVEVLHSDLGFVLLYGNNVSEGIVRATVQALQPYPRGLLTNVGMVVANAAYDTNTTDIQTFNNLQYHGAVSWSWQQGLMASGISRQLGLCGLSQSTQLTQLAPSSSSSSSSSSSNSSSSSASNTTTTTTTTPTWCNDTSLTASLLQAQQRLWYSIAGSAPALYTEVLSPVFANGTNNGTFSIGDLGAISPTGTEGDAVQLWSYGFLAQVDPRTGDPVAAGFS